MLTSALIAIAFAQGRGAVIDSQESLAGKLQELGYKVEQHDSSLSVQMQQDKIMTEVILLPSGRKPGFTTPSDRQHFTNLLVTSGFQPDRRPPVKLSLRAVFHTPEGTNLAQVGEWFKDKGPTTATVRMDGVVFVTSGTIATDVHGSDLPGAIGWFTKNAFGFSNKFKAVNVNPLQQDWAGWQLPNHTKAAITGTDDMRALLTQWGWSYQWPTDFEPDPQVGRIGGNTCDGTVDGVNVSFTVSENRITMWSKVTVKPGIDVPALMKQVGAVKHRDPLVYWLHDKGVHIVWPPGDEVYTVTGSVDLTGRTLGPVREDVLRFARLVKGLPRE